MSDARSVGSLFFQHLGDVLETRPWPFIQYMACVTDEEFKPMTGAEAWGGFVVRALLIGVGVLLVSWAGLLVAAARLPPGLLKDLAGFLPGCITLVRRLSRDPRVPLAAKVALWLGALWIVSPIDPIPDWLPVIGPLDEVLVVVLVLRYVGRRVPRAVLLEAWPGNPRILGRLLGGSRD